MKTALVISSFVGASHVGASVSAFCLRRLGITTFILPTTLFGRHPGWGAPGGGPVDAKVLTDMWDGLKAQGLKIDAVLTGYMASAAQVKVAASIIDAVRAQNPNAHIIVDPVMGDHGTLYIPKETANALVDTLVSRADIITPNLWELGYVTGKPVNTKDTILSALQGLPPMALVSSVPGDADIGAVFYSHKAAFRVRHDEFDKVPHGGGDALAGVFLAHILDGATPQEAMAKSVGSIFDILSHAARKDLTDLPLIQYQDRLIEAAPLKLERYSRD